MKKNPESLRESAIPAIFLMMIYGVSLCSSLILFMLITSY
jgi:hypothetical protein